jgi:hypothetical protein
LVEKSLLKSRRFKDLITVLGHLMDNPGHHSSQRKVSPNRRSEIPNSDVNQLPFRQYYFQPSSFDPDSDGPVVRIQGKIAAVVIAQKTTGFFIVSLSKNNLINA